MKTPHHSKLSDTERAKLRLMRRADTETSTPVSISGRPRPYRFRSSHVTLPHAEALAKIKISDD